MAKTFTGLSNAITTLDDADIMAADDTSASETKKITGANLKASCQAAEEDKISFSGPISSPSASANKGFLYIKDVGAKAELHYLDEDDNEIQITSGGVLIAAPAGQVAAFAMETAPTGWLECDGSAVNRTTYALLFAAIGEVYGVGDGSTTFNLPDFRGQFLRGWDHGAGIDPDAATRTDAGDGSTTGDHVGTEQDSQNKAHTHTVQNQTGAAYGQPTGQINDGAAQSGSSGGDEARPVNINVMYCIRY